MSMRGSDQYVMHSWDINPYYKHKTRPEHLCIYRDSFFSAEFPNAVSLGIQETKTNGNQSAKVSRAYM